MVDDIYRQVLDDSTMVTHMAEVTPNFGGDVNCCPTGTSKDLGGPTNSSSYKR